MISFLLYSRTKCQISCFILNICRQCNLFGCVTTKTIELVYFSEFFHQCSGTDTITQFPSGTVVSLTKRKTNKASFHQIGMTQNTLMLYTIKDQMLIYFIT